MNRDRSSRRGATLVEIIVAILILSILAVAGAVSLHYARSTASVQKQRRLATEIAGSRLEELRAASYAAIRPPAADYTVRYLTRSGTVWTVSNPAVTENVQVGELTRPMETTVQFVDSDGASASYDALRLTVSVQYYANAASWVILETIKSP